MAQKPARRHHVVSKFYLRGFADDAERITRRPIEPTGLAVPVGIADATVRKDFYKLEGDGLEPDAFENAIADVEGVTAPAFEQLIAGTEPLSLQDRYHVAMWIALHYLRSEASREMGEDIYRTISKLEVGVFTPDQMRERLGVDANVADDEVERIRARMLATADTFRVDHHGHLRLIASELQGTTNLVFFRQPWIVTRYKRKTLATSDTPVVLVPHKRDREIGMGTGIGTAGEIFVPISRQVGMHLGDLPEKYEPLPIVEAAGNALSAKWSNQRTLWNAQRAVFHHPDDDPLNGLGMPAKRMINLQSEQIEGLIRGFARQQGRPSGLPSDETSPDTRDAVADVAERA